MVPVNWDDPLPKVLKILLGDDARRPTEADVTAGRTLSERLARWADIAVPVTLPVAVTADMQTYQRGWTVYVPTPERVGSFRQNYRFSLDQRRLADHFAAAINAGVDPATANRQIIQDESERATQTTPATLAELKRAFGGVNVKFTRSP